MPWTHDFDVERHLVWTKMWGDVTRADFEEARAALQSDPRFDPTAVHLLDLREISLDLAAHDLESLASRSAFDRSARRAIVTSQIFAFGLARSYAIRRELAGATGETGVFKTLEEALSWLGVSDPDQEPGGPLV